MKKKLMMTAVVASFAFAACAQKFKKADVPAAVSASFAKQFPGIVAKWDKEGDKYEANFRKGGNTMSALYEANGALAETETDMKVDKLPSAVLVYLKANYKGKKIKEAAIITKADGAVNYEAEVDGKDVIFDASGNFLKEVKD